MRMFIDRHIHDDEKIMKKFKNLKNLEMVLFNCEEYKIKNFHVGLFASMVRFFPMFNFPNNDANVVIISDIDDIVSNQFMSNIKYIMNLNDKAKNKIHFYKHGDINKNLLMKYPMSINDKITPYALAREICSFVPLDRHILSDFIHYAKNDKSSTKMSFYAIKHSNESRYGEQAQKFIYGIDEYFINKILTEKLIKNKISTASCVIYNLYGGLNHLIKSTNNSFFSVSLTEQNLKILKKITTKLLSKIGKKYNDDISIIENYRILDKKIKINNEQLYLELYKIMLKNCFDEKYKFVFTNDVYNLILTNELFGAYKFKKIFFYNSDIPDKLIDTKYLSNEDILKLKPYLDKIKK